MGLKGFTTYSSVGFDVEGFQIPGEPSTRILWRDVIRVALCYEIHSIAILDWDYWAFQTIDPLVYPWVEITGSAESEKFSKEIRRRYGDRPIPPMSEWEDAEYCIRAYVIWPQEDAGNSLYTTRKRHWWSWIGEIKFKNKIRCFRPLSKHSEIAK